MADISDIVLRIRVDIVNSAALLQLMSSMQKVDAQQKKLSSGGGVLAKVASTMGKAFGKITGPLSRVERSLDAVFRAGVHMQSMGRDLLGFSSKMVGVAKSLVKSWGDFEFTLNRAAAAADIFDTQSPIYDKLKASVYDLAHELRVFPAEEVAKGLYFWQSTTGEVIKTQEDLKRTTTAVAAVMKVAAMTDTSYETAIKGVYATLKQFNLTTKDTANVSALLFYATQKTALEFPDLINSLKMTGAVAGQAHEPLQTMVAILGAIGNAGIRGSQAGRALRQTYIKIVKPTAAAKAELDKLFKAQGGYNKVAFNSKGNFIGMEKYVTKLAKATKNMTYEQKAHLLATITTANELPVMTQMVSMATAAQKAGAKSWVEFAVSQEKANEIFKKSWDILSTSWRGVVGGLKQSVQPILLEVGHVIAQVLTPTLQKLSDTIYNAGPAFTDMAKSIGETFRPVVEWVGRAIDMAITWAQQNKKLVSTFAKWGVIGTVVAGVAGAFLLAAGTLTFLVANVALLIVGMLPLLAVFLAGGVAVAAFARGVYNNVGGIKDAMKDFGVAVMRVLKMFIGGSEDATLTVDDLKQKFKELSDSLTGKIADVLRRITDALNKLTPEQVDIIKKIVKALVALKLLNTGLGIFFGTVNNVAGAFSNLGKAMQFALPHIAKAISVLSPSNLKSAGTALLTLATTALTAGKTIGAALYAALGPVGVVIGAIVLAIGAFVLAYETNFMGFKDFVDGLVAWFIQNVLPVIQQAIEFLGPIVAGIVDAISGFVTTAIGIIQGLIDFFANLPANIQKFFDDIITNVSNFINSFITNIVAFLTDLANNWSYYLGYILGVFIALPIKIMIELAKFIISFVAAAIDFLSKLPGIFADWFGKVLGFLVGWFGGVITSVAKWAGEIIGGVVDWFAKLPGRVLEWLGKVWTTLSTWFVNTAVDVAKAAGDMVQGIIDFFIALPGNIVNAIKDFPGNIIQVFKNIAKAGSDLIKSVIGIGEAILKGIWQGITNMVGWLTDKITGFFGGLVDGIKDTLGIKSPSRVMAGIGQNMIDGLAVGIDKTTSAKAAMDGVINDLTNTATSAMTGLTSDIGGTFNAKTSTDATRKIELSVDVTSADGSVNSMDLNTLAGLITGSDMTRALERMSTVD